MSLILALFSRTDCTPSRPLSEISLRTGRVVGEAVDDHSGHCTPCYFDYLVSEASSVGGAPPSRPSLFPLRFRLLPSHAFRGLGDQPRAHRAAPSQDDADCPRGNSSLPRSFSIRVPASLKGQHRAAYVIGRISMAWGLIEQRLYHDIIRFQQAKNKNLYPHEAEIAATFDDRVKQWRRLCASITAKLSDVDRVITRLNSLALVRHHVAHGYPIYFKGFPNTEQLPSQPYLEIIEHRETTTRLLRHIKLAKEKKLGRVWATDLYARYTLTDLENKWKELEKLGSDLFAASDGVLPTPKPKLPKRPRKKKRVLSV